MKVKDTTTATPLPEGVTHWEGPPLEAWLGCWRPQQAAERLAGVNANWCVVGGWSIDLFLGRETRVHEDLEIAIPRGDFGAIRAAFAGLERYSVGDGQVRRLAQGEDPPANFHQNWFADEKTWLVDVMLEPGDAETWIFRRDKRITAPRTRMVGVTDGGTPYLRPHGAILYKAKPERRPKDEADFDAVLPMMAAEDRQWLKEALTIVDPSHDWLARI